MILALAGRDFQSRYMGTLGGIVWAVVQPIAIVVVFYFVFAVGFRVTSPSDVPFILWFVCGLIPWFFFNDSLLAIANSISRNSHLVKTTVFPTEVLPLVHTAASLIPHVIFMFILLALLIFFSVPFFLERILMLYYLFCTVTLLVGLGWLFSSLQVIYRDISHALPVVMNIWFWSTPIVWPQTLVPEGYREILFWNPMFYVIEGYRESMIYNSVEWPSIAQTSYFWGVTISMLLLGGYVFHRLKWEFADFI